MEEKGKAKGKGYSSAAPLCSSGCGRAAFGGHPSCCTHCRGPDGPHAEDCKAKSEFKRSMTGVGAGRGGMILIRVVRAKLNRSFDLFGKMDPFCQVKWCSGDWESGDISQGPQIKEIGRTKTHWGGHMAPEWDHMCKGATYSGTGGGDIVTFAVSEENMQGMAKATFCGEVTIKVEELLHGAAPVADGVISTQLKQIPFKKKGVVEGTIIVQVVLNPNMRASQGQHSSGYTPVDSSGFVTPVKRLGVSGGTAPFFALKLQATAPGKSVDHWIGKDLSRATDEISFYEQRQALMLKGGHGLEKMFEFMFDYAGVLTSAEAGGDIGAADLELLVLRNLRDGCKNLRMLDIKIGSKTAAANWQGKSRFAALKQSIVDGLTNSDACGFRLEGFDGKPPGLCSMDPLLDIRRMRTSTDSSETGKNKKAYRMMLQRMAAPEMFMHFLDVHQGPEDSVAPTQSVSDFLDDSQSPEDRFSCIEVAEIVMGEIISKLVQLTRACRMAPVPQKWIGSSVALGFDDQTLPVRSSGEKQILKTVRVNIFDWGRSELNTLENHTELSAEDQADRLLYWNYYTGGIDRLAWEAARHYWHRFGNTVGWQSLELQVFDYDSFSANDIMGKVAVPLAPVDRVTVTLRDAAGNEVDILGKPSTLTYSIAWHDFPKGSRLRGAWRISIYKAGNLPAYDLLTTMSSDPFVAIVAVSGDCQFHYRQTTAIVTENLNPVWNESFDLPVSLGLPGEFKIFLENLMKDGTGSSGRAADAVQKTFFPAAALEITPADDAAFTLFSQRLSKLAGGRSFSRTF